MKESAKINLGLAIGLACILAIAIGFFFLGMAACYYGPDFFLK